MSEVAKSFSVSCLRYLIYRLSKGFNGVAAPWLPPVLAARCVTLKTLTPSDDLTLLWKITALIVDLIPSQGETNDLRNGSLHGMQTGCVGRSGGSAYHTRSTRVCQSYPQQRGILSV